MRVLKPGLRLKSAVCTTEIMVIRSPGAQASISCGGADMLATTESAPPGVRLDPAFAQGSLIGKRYVDAADSLELLCTKGGEGAIVVNGEPLGVKQAKALPSSD
jgi:hypothetical protein